MHSIDTRPANIATYAASAAFTPAAAATDIVTAIGSATKLVRVLSMRLATTNTAASSQQIAVIKRSAADTTGTFVAGTAVPFDSAFPTATAVVGHYTANPGGLGAAVGTINTLRVASPVLVGGSFAGVVRDAGIETLPIDPATGLVLPVALRGIAETLAISLGGAALISGQVHTYTVVWTEE